jgi:hypothetical protein
MIFSCPEQQGKINVFLINSDILEYTLAYLFPFFVFKKRLKSPLHFAIFLCHASFGGMATQIHIFG